MGKQRLLTRVERAWSDFKQSYAGLSDSQLIEPGVQGMWSVRDIVAHVTTWEEEALTHLPLIFRGGRPARYSTRYGGIDAFNALMTERKRHLSLAEVLRQSDEVHERLNDYIHGVPEELLAEETRFRRRLRLDAYGHYPKHARAIRTWRNGRRRDGASTTGLRQALCALVLGLVLSTSTAAAQQLQPAPDSVRVQIHTSLRAFYFNLAHRDWDALTADILAAKVVAHRPVPEALLIAAASPRQAAPAGHRGGGSSPASDQAGDCSSGPPPRIDRAIIVMDGPWAQVSVPRCGSGSGGADEFRLIRFEGRWRIVYIALFPESMSVVGNP